MNDTLRVDVWSDIVCPWCAIGKRRLDRALEGFAHRDAVRVVWRAFELDPAAPAVRDGDYAERLAQKYRRTKAEAEAMIRNVSEVAAADGLDFRLRHARSGNTFDAHRLVALAAARGKQRAVMDRFFRGYMTEEQAIGDHETLVRLAAEAGLDADEARAVVASDQYAAEVRADEAEARAIGITGVPFFVLAGKYAVSGAQPVTILRSALEQAWASVPKGPASGAEGASCGPEVCP